jgi:hypothetical protein
MLSAIPPVILFTKIGRSILKFIWKYKRSQTDKAILSQKSNAGGVTITDFNLLQSDSNKNNMVLGQKQTCRLMEYKTQTQTYTQDSISSQSKQLSLITQTITNTGEDLGKVKHCQWEYKSL